MKITEVKVFPVKKDNEKLKAYASVTFDDCFVVTGIKIVNGSNGLFVAMPSNKGADGEFHDVAFPINKETREFLQDTILKKYNDNNATVQAGMHA